MRKRLIQILLMGAINLVGCCNADLLAGCGMPNNIFRLYYATVNNSSLSLSGTYWCGLEPYGCSFDWTCTSSALSYTAGVGCTMGIMLGKTCYNGSKMESPTTFDATGIQFCTIPLDGKISAHYQSGKWTFSGCTPTPKGTISSLQMETKSDSRIPSKK
jgi:hypothetical protein